MFGDIGIGILLSIIVSVIFHIHLTLYLVMFGIVASLLPDIDMLTFVSPLAKKILVGHRQISHYPILYIPIIFLIWFFFGLPLALLSTAAIYIHLLHDTIWIGWGIQWFWPLSKKPYRFFLQDSKALPHTHWIRAFYFRPTIVSVTEYSIFILSIIALLYDFSK